MFIIFPSFINNLLTFDISSLNDDVIKAKRYCNNDDYDCGYDGYDSDCNYRIY
jgi:hypothetical protein